MPWPVTRGVGVHAFPVFPGKGLGTAWAMGVGVYVCAVCRGSGLGRAWAVTRGVVVHAFAVFPGSGLGTAWAMGVGVYVCAVCRGSGLGMAWAVKRGGRGLCVRCVSWERTRYGVAREARGSGFMCLLCFMGADSVWRGP